MSNINVYELFKLPKGSKTGVYCEKCGSEMIIRESHSKFLGCGSYPKCKEVMQFCFPEKKSDSSVSTFNEITAGRTGVAHPHLGRLFLQREDWITDIHGNEEREFFETLKMCFDR